MDKWVSKLKAFYSDKTISQEGEMVAQLENFEKIQKMFMEAMKDAGENFAAAAESDDIQSADNEKYSFKGYDEETGRGIYEGNFPKGTPKSAKAERILSYIQNVWSQKPIPLIIRNEDGSERKIMAAFDPTYDEKDGKQSDASKLMGGNRHGSGSEQRVTLDLADDYYQIASESVYNYLKPETGKDSIPHQGVQNWHYFINDILFQEHGETDVAPYRVTINVKEKNDGSFVYSFSAERQEKKASTHRTLHADVTPAPKSESNAQPFNNSIEDTEPIVKGEKNSLRDEEVDTSPRGILMRMDVKSRKLDAEKYHLGRYQERVTLLGESEQRLAEVKAEIEKLSTDEKGNRKELTQLRSEQRNLNTTIKGLKRDIKFTEQTDMFRKMVSDGRLAEYRAEQREAEKARILEYRAMRNEITGMNDVMSVMEDEFVRLARD